MLTKIKKWWEDLMFDESHSEDINEILKSVEVVEDKELTRNIKRNLYTYCENNEINWRTWQLHSITTDQTSSKSFPFPFTKVNVTLGNPGMLIGPYGETIDKLEQFLANKLGHSVKINIKEFSAWD